MNITIATPLYPPDIDPPAAYIKELAKRLSNKHKVTIVLYGHLPENIAGVDFCCVDKRQPAVARLPHFFFKLRRAARDVDMLYVQNGISVELPVLLWSLLTQKPFIVHMGDVTSLKRAEHNAFFKFIERQIRKRAQRVIEDTPQPRPEILPFGEKPVRALDEFEHSWNEHIESLEQHLTYQHA